MCSKVTSVLIRYAVLIVLVLISIGYYLNECSGFCEHFGKYMSFWIKNEWLKIGIAYFLHFIINELSWAIKKGLMVNTVPINFSDSFPSCFLVNNPHKLLIPKRKVFFLVKLMLYNPLWTLKFLGELSWIFGWIVQFVWVNWFKI